MEKVIEQTQRLLELSGHDENPFAVYFTDARPEDGYSPKPGQILSRERERAGQIDWKRAASEYSCFIGKIWLARKNKKAAWLSQEEYGCWGVSFFCGMFSPHLDMDSFFLSTGIPGTQIEGEHFFQSPEAATAALEESTPPPAKGKYCVMKPLEQFTDEEEPLIVTFFVRPEVLNGLYMLACFAIKSHHAVVCPFGSGCCNIAAWPLVYQQRGEEKAVIGGLDLNARKYLKPDELTFSIPFSMYRKMLDSMEESALARPTWETIRKKASLSRSVWEKYNEK
ncbi:MAG: DUF169 domain-containing protein [Holosporaceae bacterium]|jgi:hypothetical protein|nr:DUF169 domain-containing protein [Holosporaceae bacterium]